MVTLLSTKTLKNHLLSYVQSNTKMFNPKIWLTQNDLKVPNVHNAYMCVLDV